MSNHIMVPYLRWHGRQLHGSNKHQYDNSCNGETENEYQVSN